MASCFRTVSNRLCCSNYLKTPGILHLDTKNTSSTKITQSNSFNKVSQVPVSLFFLIPPLFNYVILYTSMLIAGKLQFSRLHHQLQKLR